MTERTRSQIQAAEMSFLRRVAGRSLRDRVRSSVTREELRVKPLLFHIERGQLKWLGHLFRMPPGRLPGKVFRARPTGRRPPGRPRTDYGDTMSPGWPGNASVSPRRSWRKCLGRGKSGHLCLDCCPRDPAPDKRKKMDGWMDGWIDPSSSFKLRNNPERLQSCYKEALDNIQELKALGDLPEFIVDISGGSQDVV